MELWTDNEPLIKSIKLDFGLKIYTYKGIRGNEDYNRYDDIIMEAVKYWNDEFLHDTDSPKELLDPNLVKAILYQESRVGYNPNNNGEINIMQVGNEGDPSLKTLRGELAEYWIHNGEQIKLEYLDAKIETVRDSIFWGVRWLYHKAQKISEDDPVKRIWRTWKEAVEKYGPPGTTKEYVNSIWNIYQNGIKKEKNGNLIKLWGVILLLGLLTASLLNFNDKKADFRSHNKSSSQTAAISHIKESITVISGNFENKEDAFREAIRTYYASERHWKIQDTNIIIESYKNNPSLVLGVIEWDKDWWEDLRVGIVRDRSVEWLEIEEPPTEQSILSARFVQVKGFSNPIIEIYGQTHMGHGNIYIYEVEDNKIRSIFTNSAVDIHHENVWKPGNTKKYGYGYCSQEFENGKLYSNYADINNDGVSDLTLTGKINLICYKQTKTDDGYVSDIPIKIAEIPVQEIYFWGDEYRTFLNCDMTSYQKSYDCL